MNQGIRDELVQDDAAGHRRVHEKIHLLHLVREGYPSPAVAQTRFQEPDEGGDEIREIDVRQILRPVEHLVDEGHGAYPLLDLGEDFAHARVRTFLLLDVQQRDHHLHIVPGAVVELLEEGLFLLQGAPQPVRVRLLLRDVPDDAEQSPFRGVPAGLRVYVADGPVAPPRYPELDVVGHSVPDERVSGPIHGGPVLGQGHAFDRRDAELALFEPIDPARALRGRHLSRAIVELPAADVRHLLGPLQEESTFLETLDHFVALGDVPAHGGDAVAPAHPHDRRRYLELPDVPHFTRNRISKSRTRPSLSRRRRKRSLPSGAAQKSSSPEVLPMTSSRRYPIVARNASFTSM